MTIRSLDYAFLSDDAYETQKVDQPVTLNGVNYKIVAVANEFSGYQATAYQRIDTGEVVIANRGTEFFSEPYRDVIKADAGMVRTGLNSQLDDAIVFTNQVRGLVHQLEQRQHRSIPITVTGHSLGGALAEILSYRFGFHGETFNAYGVAGLTYGIPEGGNRVINHVVATDAVSAASAHFGEVRIYAFQKNIDDLHKAGYGVNDFPLSNANPLLATNVQAHQMKNFLPGNDLTGESIMAPNSAERYLANHRGIDSFRTTIMEDRKVLSGEWALQGQMTPDEVAHRTVRIESQLDAMLKQSVSDKAVGAIEGAPRFAAHATLQGIDAIDRAGTWVADAIKADAQRIYNGLDSFGKALGSDAVERAGRQAMEDLSHAYDTAKDSASAWMKQRDGSPEPTDQRAGNRAPSHNEHVAPPSLQPSHAPATQHPSQKAEPDTAKAQEPISLVARIDRMLAAADAGDWKRFDQDTQAFAQMPPGRELWARTVEMANLEDRLVAQHQAEMQKMQQDFQQTMQQQHAVSQGRGHSR